MKRKRPQNTTPQIKYNAYARDYEKALVAFVRAMAKSAGYHITAALKRQGIITEDASTPTDFRLTLQELFKRYDKQAGDFAEKITGAQIREIIETDTAGEWRDLEHERTDGLIQFCDIR